MHCLGCMLIGKPNVCLPWQDRRRARLRWSRTSERCGNFYVVYNRLVNKQKFETPAAGLSAANFPGISGGETSLALDDQLCFSLYAASLAMTKMYRSLLAETGLTYPQYIVMLALWQNDGVAIGTLGGRVALDSGTLTPLLKRMEKAGLLVRTRDLDDERSVIISLTAQGHDLYGRAAAIQERAACATALPAGEATRLSQVLRQLRHALVAR